MWLVVVGPAILLYWVPLYYSFKMILLLWCMLPQFRGGDVLHRKVFGVAKVSMATAATVAGSASDVAVGPGGVCADPAGDSDGVGLCRPGSASAAVVAGAAAERSSARDYELSPDVTVSPPHQDTSSEQHEYVDVFDGATPTDRVLNTDPSSDRAGGDLA
jgi:hypothetical protein